MIVHPPELFLQQDSVILSAEVEYQKPVKNIPGRLWFKLPHTFQHAITLRSDAFLAGLMTTAMALDEPLQICGEVSPRLLFGLRAYQRILLCWFPKLFQQVPIECDTLSALETKTTADAVGMAYSGGVDSTYTLMSHLSENQPLPGYQVTHALFLHGFDIPLRAVRDFESAKNSLQPVLQTLGVRLIPCSTNLHAFTEGRIPWVYAFGPVVLSAALALGNLFQRFIVAPSFSYHESKPWGSSPITDPLFSTESMDVVHFGAGKEKFDRIASIAAWKPAQQSLRVCINLQKRHGIRNCCRCKKCIMTMTLLFITGQLPNFDTFEKSFSIWDVFRWLPHYNQRSGYAPRIIRYAWIYKKFALIPIMAVLCLSGLLRYLLVTLMPRKLFLWLKSRVYPLEKNAFAYVNLPEEGEE